MRGSLLVGLCVACLVHASWGSFPLDRETLSKAKELAKTAKKLLPISTEEEIAVGKRVAARIQQRYGVYKNRAVEEYVALVGTAVSWRGSRKDLEYNFTILDTDELNAFAAPGGFIMVSRGLLARMETEAELAALLGHEIWHVEARHEVKRIQEAQVAGFLVSKALSAMSAEELAKVADLCVDVLDKGRSRDKELEADVEGVRLAAGLGYSPAALAALLERIGGSREDRSLTWLLQTHPPTADRVRELKKRYQGASQGVLLRERFAERMRALKSS